MRLKTALGYCFFEKSIKHLSVPFQGTRLLIARDQVLTLERVVQPIIKLLAAVAVANINLSLRGQCFDRAQRGGNPRERGDRGLVLDLGKDRLDQRVGIRRSRLEEPRQ